TAASCGSSGPFEGLNGGRLCNDPNAAAATAIAKSGTIFRNVMAICATLISFSPRILMMVNAAISASALDACRTALCAIARRKNAKKPTNQNRHAGMPHPEPDQKPPRKKKPGGTPDPFCQKNKGPPAPRCPPPQSAKQKHNPNRPGRPKNPAAVTQQAIR